MINVMEEVSKNYTELGIAMFAYFTGRELDDNQIEMINNADVKRILSSMQFVAYNNLKGKGQLYTNFCKNKKRIEAVIKSKDVNKFNIVDLICLGSAMFGYYGGELLMEEQILLIANSSEEEKLNGMKSLTEFRLRDNPNYYNYSKNSIKLKKRGNKKR